MKINVNSITPKILRPFQKKHDQHHLGLEASKDITKMFNKKLNQYFKSIKK